MYGGHEDDWDADNDRNCSGLTLRIELNQFSEDRKVITTSSSTKPNGDSRCKSYNDLKQTVPIGSVGGESTNISQYSTLRVKSFEPLGLPSWLSEGREEAGWVTPTNLQQICLPSLLLTKPPANVLIQSPSGTGKTVASVLTILKNVNTNNNFPQIYCLTPNEESIVKLNSVLKPLAKSKLNVNVKLAAQGETISRGHKLTENIIIGTPRRVLHWAVRFRAIDLKKLTLVVVFQAEEMTESKSEAEQDFQKIFKQLSKDCQLIIFSVCCDNELTDYFEKMPIKELVSFKMLNTGA